MVIRDVFRWMVALMVLPAVIWQLFVIFLYMFEFMLRLGIGEDLYYHLRLWFIGGIVIWILNLICGGFAAYTMFIVRQKSSYALLLCFAMFCAIWFVIYLGWSPSIFSWQSLEYPIINKICFTILVLLMIQIPLEAAKAAQKEPNINGKDLFLTFSKALEKTNLKA